VSDIQVCCFAIFNVRLKGIGNLETATALLVLEKMEQC
jgi:hypothetical protein